MEKYVNLKKIASGSYGDIFKTKIENKDVVVKKIFFDNDKELEICMLVNNLKISYFVKFIEKINKNIIYEYFNGETLDYELYNLNLDEIEKISFQLIKFLHELEEKQYYYFDLNMNNILIDKNRNIKIIDYSTLNHKNELTVNKVGTYYFVPPEYFNDNIIIKNKFDVFSLGVIIFNLIFKYPPLRKSSDYKNNCICGKNCLEESCLQNIINEKKVLKNKQLLIKLLINCLKYNYKIRKNILQNFNLIMQ
jgi:serine/threonine protein kinase